MTNRTIFLRVMELLVFLFWGVFRGEDRGITLGGGRRRGESREGSGETD